MTDINVNENVYSASEMDAADTENAKEKMFTQSRLEEIISERLSRERKVNESLLSVKTLLKKAADKGLIKGGSYAEMAADLVERLKAGSMKEESNVTDESENFSTGDENSPCNVCDDTDLLTEAEESSADAAAEENEDVQNEYAQENAQENLQGEKSVEQDNSFASTLCDIKARYPKEKLEKLLCGDLFERFAKGRSGSVKEIVDDFFGFISSFSPEAEAEENEPSGYSAFASTAFSSQSGNSRDVNLTKQQMEIAKSAGMSYREYANLLESVPKRTRKAF